MSTDIKLCVNCPSMMFFTAKQWCGHCKKIEPTLANMLKLQRNKKLGFHVAQYDDSTAAGKIAIRNFNIKAFPTALVYIPRSDGTFSLQAVSRTKRPRQHCHRYVESEAR